MAALALCAFVYVSAIPGTGGSRAVDLDTELPVASLGSLNFENNVPVITGSLSPMFDSPVFTGTNRAEKTERALPRVDVAEFSQAFEAARIEVAEARKPATPQINEDAIVLVASADEEASVPEPEQAQEQAEPAEPEQATVKVAAVDASAVSTEALRAIDAATGDVEGGADLTVPRPTVVPEALAFARSNTPATDFTPKHEWDDRQQWCMSTGIYFEARGESYRGQVAVAQVILNRVAHENYPDTICGVVYQNQHRRNACQFSFACDGITDRINEPGAWAKAQDITQRVLNDEMFLTEIADATHYHATYVKPRWAGNMTKLSQVGLHVFYKFRAGWTFG